MVDTPQGVFWRGGREAEGGRLLTCYRSLYSYPGFESLSLRQDNLVSDRPTKPRIYGAFWYNSKDPLTCGYAG